jgi:hypothetical protein
VLPARRARVSATLGVRGCPCETGIAAAMDRLEDLLRPLLKDGRVVFRGPPAPDWSGAEALDLLGSAFEDARLDVAGAPIDLDGAVALEGGRVVVHACYALLSREESAEELGRRLAMSRGPTTPSHHLSADLLFRYLPQVYLRARAMNPSDGLAVLLAELLREWPLSGVLANLDEGPRCPPDMGGHEGLMLLYAERWARRRNPSWRPEGRAGEYVELVLRDLDRDKPLAAGAGNARHG